MIIAMEHTDFIIDWGQFPICYAAVEQRMGTVIEKKIDDR